MKTKIAVRLGASFIIAFFAIGSWLTSGALNLEPMKYLSGTIFLTTVLFSIWDIWVWRLPLAQMIPGVPLCLRGTWSGRLESSWVDPSGQGVASKDSFLVVRQTSSLVHVTLLTGESKSESSLAGVTKTEGLSVLHYLYFNRPKMRHEEVSRMHHGSTTLEVSGNPARRLVGRYWTDRDTRGELDFARHTKKIADDYEEATSLFSSE